MLDGNGPRLGVVQEPRLIDATGWSDWFETCYLVLREPKFLAARDPTRKAMLRAYVEGDMETMKRLMDEFLRADEKFCAEVVAKLRNPKIFGKLDGGTVVYLCAGVDFARDLSILVGPEGKLFLVDHAPSIIKYLNMVITKNKDSSAPKVFKALEMPAHLIGSEQAHQQGIVKGEVDAILAIRGAHRVPPEERVQMLGTAQEQLKPGGIILLVELFEKDRATTREPTPGAWHWHIEQYEAELPGMTRVEIEGPDIIFNQDDKCRLVVFQKN